MNTNMLVERYVLAKHIRNMATDTSVSYFQEKADVRHALPLIAVNVLTAKICENLEAQDRKRKVVYDELAHVKIM